ncbi:MAG: hypothetical protein LBO79_03815 [Zoogloeaceae bacterium]|nr:hypothetical protein [Zoogloeaceae bacterium]
MTGQEMEVEKTVVGSCLCARDRQAFSLAIARAQGRPDNRLFHFSFLSCHVPLHHGNLHARHVPETVEPLNPLIPIPYPFSHPHPNNTGSDNIRH